MAEGTNGAGGAPANAGGEGGKVEGENSNASGEGKKDQVAYETHLKLLEEKKKLQKELEAFKKAEDENKKKLLEEQGEFKKLNELLKEKVTTLEEKEKQREKELLDAVKISAFKELLPGKVSNPAYYGFVDLDKIVVNPETGEIDKLSLESEVKRFVSSHSRLIESGGKNPYDSKAPGQGGTSYIEDLKKCKTQAEFDAVRRKYGKDER